MKDLYKKEKKRKNLIVKQEAIQFPKMFVYDGYTFVYANAFHGYRAWTNKGYTKFYISFDIARRILKIKEEVKIFN